MNVDRRSPKITYSVVELDKKEGLLGKNCYQAKFSTVGIAKLSSLRLEEVRINPIWATLFI